jgi:hypothetical protein
MIDTQLEEALKLFKRTEPAPTISEYRQPDRPRPKNANHVRPLIPAANSITTIS